MTRLDEHLATVGDALGGDWDGWPECAATAPMPPDARVSAVLLLLAEPPQTVTVPGTEGLISRITPDPGAGVLDRLRQRTLPWCAATAATAVEVVTGASSFDDRRVRIALRAAEQVCREGRADSRLLTGLEACGAWLESLPSHVHRMRDTRTLLRKVVVAATPPELLDLSLLVDDDAWGAPAMAAALRHPPEQVTGLVRVLGALGELRPSQRWLRDVAEELAHPAARQLLRDWLELAQDTAACPVGPSSEPALFARGNVDLVRAAVLAARVLEDDTWIPGVLGFLARRGAATSPGSTESLSLKVAGAAVDSLVARMGPEDRKVLEELLEDLARRDLVKRVGAALGSVEQAAERSEALRREKTDAVRRKASPVPRQERAEVDALLRRHLGPVLRGSGFTGSGRTWRRPHPDRVDVVSLGSTGLSVTLVFGTRFTAAHPAGPQDPPLAAARVLSHHLDVRLAEHHRADDPGMDVCARRITEVVVPFLDTMGRYELVRAYLERDAGAPAGATSLGGRPGSPATRRLLDLLALAAGEPPVS